MTITYPIDLLSGFPGWTPEFDINWSQVRSTQRNSVARRKDIADPVWRMRAVSKTLSANNLDIWRAKLESLQGGINTFYGYSLSRCYPIAYPNGTWPTGASFDGVSAAIYGITGTTAVRVDGLPVGFELSVGDMIQIGTTDLHRVAEAATANGSGISGWFEVFPRLWTGVAEDDAVSVYRPHCIMRLIPETVRTVADPSTGRGSISFEAIEDR